MEVEGFIVLAGVSTFGDLGLELTCCHALCVLDQLPCTVSHPPPRLVFF